MALDLKFKIIWMSSDVEVQHEHHLIKLSSAASLLLLLHEMHDVILHMVTGMICMLQCINRSRLRI